MTTRIVDGYLFQDDGQKALLLVKDIEKLTNLLVALNEQERLCN